jgi:hypothetical protein
MTHSMIILSIMTHSMIILSIMTLSNGQLVFLNVSLIL